MTPLWSLALSKKYVPPWKHGGRETRSSSRCFARPSNVCGSLSLWRCTGSSAKRDLDKHARHLDAKVFEFAEASVLTVPKSLEHMPEASWSDARAEVRDRVHKTGQAAKELGTSVVQAGADGASKHARKAREQIKRRP